MQCRVCDHTIFSLGVDLGMHPIALHFLKQEQLGKEPFYPLKVIVCEKCSTAQLYCILKKEAVYIDHTYLSWITRSLAEHFERIAQTVDQRFFPHQKKKTVLDIGSNDGTHLKAYKALGYEVIGVEAAKTVAEIANRNNVPTVHAF